MLNEFREARRAEIEAPRRAAQSSAVSLLHGELIGRAADAYQDVFRLEHPQLALPHDVPGDLYVPVRQRIDATIISLAGSTLTLSVAEDLGAHVARASLSSNLTNLPNSLMTCIELISVQNRENPAKRGVSEGPWRKHGQPAKMPGVGD